MGGCDDLKGKMFGVGGDTIGDHGLFSYKMWRCVQCRRVVRE